MKNILSIFKKELKRFFTDKKLLATLLLPGLLIFVVYSLMGDAFKSKFDVSENSNYIVYVINNPNNEFSNGVDSGIRNALNKDDFSYENANESELDNLKDKLKNKEIDLIVLYKGDFSIDSLLNPDVEKSVEVYQNSTKTESSYIYSLYIAILDQIEDELTSIYDVNKIYNEDTKYDVATAEDAQISVLTMILPMLVMMLLFSGCMAVVPESIAGEKERGTIATLLITPLRRSELAIGKIMSLSVISVCSAISSFIGIALSMPKLMGDTGKLVYGFKEYAIVLAVLVVTVLLFVTLLSIVSAQSKSVKEAGMYATPVMILVMIISMTLMFGGSDVSIAKCFIPVYNSALILKSIFSLEINVLGITVTIISNILYTSLGVFLLAKMFNSERIMFKK